MPDSYLAILIDELRDEMDRHIGAFRDGLIDADTFQQRAARDLAEHHVAAYLVGRDDQVIRAADKRILAEVIGNQVDYLNGFADVLAAREDEEWSAALEARARMYAGSLSETYWRGQTRGYTLPYYPGDGGTECITNCRCRWEIDGGTAYWRLGAAEHCSGCVGRGANNPHILEAA